MKILTLNAQRSEHKDDLIRFLNDALAYTVYDVVLLQEMQKSTMSEVKHHNYEVIHDTEIQSSNGRVMVLLNKKHSFIKTDHSLFERQKTETKEYFFELISVVFEEGDHRYVISSLHMPAYLHVFRRIKHLRKALWRTRVLKKECFVDRVVLGGDWNALFPFERYLLSLVVGSKMKRLSTDDYTVISRNIEDGLFWNKVAKNISPFINLSQIADFFFVSKEIKGTVSVLETENVISDHKPVVLELE